MLELRGRLSLFVMALFLLLPELKKEVDGASKWNPGRFEGLLPNIKIRFRDVDTMNWQN